MADQIQANLTKFWPSSTENVVFHLRQLYSAVNDHDQAITTLSQGTSTTSNNVNSSVSAVTGPITIINNNTSSFPGLGAVNIQTGIPAYTVMNTDNGALVLVGDVAPVAVTLDSALSTPYFTLISNSGTSDAVITPTTGTVNGLPSLTLPAGSWVQVYYDGINWEAQSPGGSVGGVNQIIAGTNVTISPAGGTGAVTINSSGSGVLVRVPHNVSGSRAFGTTYQNTTGVEMIVSGYGTTNGGSTDTLTAFIDTLSPPTAFAVWGLSPTATIVGGQAGFNFTVPNNYYYRIVIGGSAITGLGSWIETY